MPLRRGRGLASGTGAVMTRENHQGAPVDEPTSETERAERVRDAVAGRLDA